MTKLFSQSEKQNKRLQDIITALESFTEGLDNNFSTKKDAAKKINDWYWFFIEKEVKIHFSQEKGGHRINVYKICSATELAIVHVQPIIHQDIIVQRKINARFAFKTALAILLHWKKIDVESNELFSFTKREEIDAFMNEHVIWLSKLKPEFGYPVFSNSQTWMLLFYLIAGELNLEINDHNPYPKLDF